MTGENFGKNFESIPAPDNKDKEKEEQKLQDFIGEIAALHDEEQEKRKTAHFSNSDFNPQELTREDMEMWQKFKDDIITKEEFNTYKQRLEQIKEEKAQKGISSRVFCAYLANKLAVVFGQRELEEIRKSKEQKKE